MHQVPESFKSQLAIMQFAHKASEWYDSFLIDHEPPTWLELIRLVRKYFHRTMSKSGMEELKELHQIRYVEEYIEHFE
jgi:Retrotransposon gag protein